MIYRNISFLFTGDIEKEAEGKILQLGYSLDSTVLKVPHHGSITSSTPSFIKEVNPKYAIISVGRNNAFGHPHEGVIERLEHTGARVYRTDLDGGITIRTDGEGIVVKTTVDR
jgi:competence protein ComEC